MAQGIATQAVPKTQEDKAVSRRLKHGLSSHRDRWPKEWVFAVCQPPHVGEARIHGWNDARKWRVVLRRLMGE